MYTRMIAMAAVLGALSALPTRGDEPRMRSIVNRTVVIPAGTYVPLYADHGPVAVRSFRIDATPVTRGQYAAFIHQPAPASQKYAMQPATRLTRASARAYCVAQGKRLPSVDEWEMAGSASAVSRQGTSDPAFRQQLLDLYSRKRELRPVGQSGANIYGVMDMHGLVWEWTESPSHHASHAGKMHDLSCAGSALGASTTADFAAFLRYAFRAGLTDSSSQQYLGFRCAQTV